MMMISVEKKNAMAKKLGRRKKRIFDIEDSNNPIIRERTAPLITNRTMAMARAPSASV